MNTTGATPSLAYTWADLIVGGVLLAGLAGLLTLITRHAAFAPGSGSVSLAWSSLPLDALFSWLRMLAAYVLSLGFALVYAYQAAFNHRAERYLIPILDVLQSIPILSFLPAVLLVFIALFPGSSLGPNLASVVLIFTSQVWNMVFGLYNGFITIPQDLAETARSLGLTRWQRFRTLELPYAMHGLVWNSMMSWAGGWFFLMAAEMFSLGNKSYQLQGLGTFLQTAANRGNWTAEWVGLLTLIMVIVLMDQLVFRPVLAWSEKFKMETVGGEPARSAVLRVVRRSALLTLFAHRVWSPLSEWSDLRFRPPARRRARPAVDSVVTLVRTVILGVSVLAAAALFRDAVHLLSSAWAELSMVLLATGASFLRVLTSLVLSVAWTVPVGVAIGLNRRLSQKLTPIIQIAASVPATALFPSVVALLLHLDGGLNTAAIVLMMLGTQWYILFNVIAGASAIPEDLKEAGRLFQLSGWQAWRTLILPAIYPYLITGLITASGGAWNTTIVAEYVSFQGHVHHVFGVGWLISQSALQGHFGLLLLSTAAMALTVVLANRLVWRRLYRAAAERYSLQ